MVTGWPSMVLATESFDRSRITRCRNSIACRSLRLRAMVELVVGAAVSVLEDGARHTSARERTQIRNAVDHRHPRLKSKGGQGVPSAARTEIRHFRLLVVTPGAGMMPPPSISRSDGRSFKGSGPSDPPAQVARVASLGAGIKIASQANTLTANAQTYCKQVGFHFLPITIRCQQKSLRIISAPFSVIIAVDDRFHVRGRSHLCPRSARMNLANGRNSCG